jgi:hypothetical protein
MSSFSSNEKCFPSTLHSNSASRSVKRRASGHVGTKIQARTEHAPPTNSNRLPEVNLSDGIVMLTVLGIAVVVREIRLLVMACKG